MPQLNGYLIFVAALVVHSDFSAALFMWKPYRKLVESVTIDRLVPGDSSEFHMPIIDRTTFSVNETTGLEQFDILPINKYQKNLEHQIVNTEVEIQIVERHTTYEKTVFTGKISVNSSRATNVKISHIRLKANLKYEIRLKMPEQQIYMYKEKLSTRKQKTNLHGRSLTVHFYQHNLKQSPNINDSSCKLSHGAVRRLHFKSRNIPE